MRRQNLFEHAERTRHRQLFTTQAESRGTSKRVTFSGLAHDIMSSTRPSPGNGIEIHRDRRKTATPLVADALIRVPGLVTVDDAIHPRFVLGNQPRLVPARGAWQAQRPGGGTPARTFAVARRHRSRVRAPEPAEEARTPDRCRRGNGRSALVSPCPERGTVPRKNHRAAGSRRLTRTRPAQVDAAQTSSHRCGLHSRAASRSVSSASRAAGHVPVAVPHDRDSPPAGSLRALRRAPAAGSRSAQVGSDMNDPAKLGCRCELPALNI
ncbi:hypothetical protein C8E87_7152 [Paractinoplanes brasiliensis]|uniref:Uncharacterized protein n=1 Tax=Paractinoplanes brasiliensis TaxID=52695 RepID=A0A4R6J818_9ACTN|nr:hypothetical protein C8E87_7152 [Actinoplanes brasiliensis]